MTDNNKYECTAEQELQHIQQVNDVTCARQASGQPAAAASGGRTSWCHLESMKSYQKLTLSIDAYLLGQQFCQNLIPIQFEMTKP